MLHIVKQDLKLQKEKMKAAKKENEAVNTVTIAQIGIEDFMKVELKAAKIVECAVCIPARLAPERHECLAWQT